MSVIDDSKFLENKYAPREIVHRGTEQKQLETSIRNLQNVHLHGSRGTGKTQLVKRHWNNQTRIPATSPVSDTTPSTKS